MRRACGTRAIGLARALASFALAVFWFAGVSAADEIGGPVELGDDDPANASAVFVTWSTGFDYSRGDYGLDRDSSLFYVPLGATFDIDYWRVAVTLPFLYSDGVVGTAVGGPTGLASDRKAGLGDAITSVSHLFAPSHETLPWVEVTAQVSWPTRTAEVLGTGNFAFAGQVDVFQSFGSFTPFARFGRNFFLAGSLDDRFYASVGASHAWNDRLSTGLSYDWLGGVAPGVSDGHELVPYASFAVGDGWSLGPYAVVGLSSGSPDYGLGLSVSFAP